MANVQVNKFLYFKDLTPYLKLWDGICRFEHMKNKGLLKFIAVLMMVGGFGIIWFGLQGIES